MELISKLIVNPLLWIAYITLPLLSGPLTSYPSWEKSMYIFNPANVWADLVCISVLICELLAVIIYSESIFAMAPNYTMLPMIATICQMFEMMWWMVVLGKVRPTRFRWLVPFYCGPVAIISGTVFFQWVVFRRLESTIRNFSLAMMRSAYVISVDPDCARFPRILHSSPVVNFFDNQPVLRYVPRDFVAFIFADVFYLMVVLPAGSLFYFVHLLLFVVVKATTLFFILGLKNRMACQLLSAVSAIMLGLSKRHSSLAAIPVSFGVFLTIPDLDPEPGIKFRARFSQFLAANMDQESLDALLNSKFCKMVSCNEMMPSLEPIPSDVGAGFQTSSGNEDLSDSNLEPEYRIGLGYIVTRLHKDWIDVGVFSAPFSGVKRMTMKNTPRSRYNLDKSARFWRDNPGTGLGSFNKLSVLHPEELKIYCMSTDEWIKACGADNSRFVEFPSSTSSGVTKIEI